MAGGRSRELAFLSLSLTAHWLVAWNEQQSVCLFVCEDTFFSAHIIRRLLILQCACAIILVGDGDGAQPVEQQQQHQLALC